MRLRNGYEILVECSDGASACVTPGGNCAVGQCTPNCFRMFFGNNSASAAAAQICVPTVRTGVPYRIFRFSMHAIFVSLEKNAIAVSIFVVLLLVVL